MSSGSDYPEPDPLPPPLPIFNNSNWPQVLTPSGGGGGGGGGGGTTYQTVSVSLTGSTANVDFTIPSNTRTFFLEMSPLNLNFSGVVFIRLGDDTNYYTNNYFMSWTGTTTAIRMPFQPFTSGGNWYSQFTNGDTIYFSQTTTSQFDFPFILTNITTPITRLRIFTTGGITINAGTNIKMTFMIQP